MNDGEITFLFILKSAISGFIFFTIVKYLLHRIPIGEDGSFHRNSSQYLHSIMSRMFYSPDQSGKVWSQVVLKLEKLCISLYNQSLSLLKYKYSRMCPLLFCILFLLVLLSDNSLSIWPGLSFLSGLLGAFLAEWEPTKLFLDSLPKSTYYLIDCYKGTHNSFKTHVKASLGSTVFLLSLVTVQSTATVWAFNHHYLGLHYTIDEYSQMFLIIFAFVLGSSVFSLLSHSSSSVFAKSSLIANDLIGRVQHNLLLNDAQSAAVISKLLGKVMLEVPSRVSAFYLTFSAGIFSGLLILSTSPQLASLASEIYLPLLLMSFSILALIPAGLITLFAFSSNDPLKISRAIQCFLVFYCVSLGFALYFSVDYLIPANFEGVFLGNIIEGTSSKIFACLIIGLQSGPVLGLVLSFYNSKRKKFAKEVLSSCNGGAGTGFILGFSFGFMSTVFPCILISILIIWSYKLLGIYGLWTVAAGSCLTLPISLFIHILHSGTSSNVIILELIRICEELVEKSEEINECAFSALKIAKGIDIVANSLVSFSVFLAFVQHRKIESFNIANPLELCGILVGSMIPYAFSAVVLIFTVKTSKKLIEELNAQCNELEKFKEYLPDYSQCFNICRETILPVFLFMFFATFVLFSLVSRSIGQNGMLGCCIGVLVSGLLIESFGVNTGFVWKLFMNDVKVEGRREDDKESIENIAINLNTVGEVLSDMSDFISIFTKNSAVLLLAFSGYLIE